MLALAAVSRRSRTLTTVLEDTLGRAVAVVNCHLEGHPDKSVARVRQLEHALAELSRGAGGVSGSAHQALVLCGDFNSPLQNSACTTYLGRGSVPAAPAIKEWGHRIVPAEASAIPGHRYTLHPAHGRPSAKDFTFSGSPGRVAAGLDQVWHSSSLACVAVRALFRSEAHRLELLRRGLPCAANPSDHIPVGAILAWNDHGARHDPRADQAVGAVAVARVALPDLRGLAGPEQPPAGTHSGGGGGADPAAATASGDPSAAAAALLLALPPALRAEFDLATAAVAGVAPQGGGKKGGRPSAEQRRGLNARRERRERLLESVGPETRALLQRVIKLRRLADKMAGSGQ